MGLGGCFDGSWVGCCHGLGSVVMGCGPLCGWMGLGGCVMGLGRCFDGLEWVVIGLVECFMVLVCV